MSICSVLGAGSGGQALAVVLKKAGHEVRVWSRNSAKNDRLLNRGCVELKGEINGSATMDAITNDLGEVVADARFVFVVIPANAHYDLALQLGALLSSSQTLVLNPGRSCGILDFERGLKKAGMRMTPLIMETQSLLFTCRSLSPGEVQVLSVKSRNRMAANRQSMGREVASMLSSVYGNPTIVECALDIAFDNMGAILHPAPVLFNTGWIESRNVFFPHYYFGISPTVAQFIELMDAERIGVARAYGVAARSVKSWHEEVYGCHGADLYETLQSNSAYASIDAPRSIKHRYLTEDIPTGLVPMSELGRAANVATPLMDMMINLGSIMLNTDFRKNGRNLGKLGLEGKTVREIKTAFMLKDA
jgi:opine dehydrogenase